MSTQKLEKFGHSLRNWILSEHKTLRDFEKVSGIKYYTLQHYLRGTRNPSKMVLLRLKSLGFSDFEGLDHAPNASDEPDSKEHIVKETAKIHPEIDRINDQFICVKSIDLAGTINGSLLMYDENPNSFVAINRRWLKANGFDGVKISNLQINERYIKAICPSLLNKSNSILIGHNLPLRDGGAALFYKDNNLFIGQIMLNGEDEWFGFTGSFCQTELDDGDVVGMIISATMLGNEIDGIK